jgi:hypothetical protein
MVKCFRIVVQVANQTRFAIVASVPVKIGGNYERRRSDNVKYTQGTKAVLLPP